LKIKLSYLSKFNKNFHVLQIHMIWENKDDKWNLSVPKVMDNMIIGYKNLTS